MAVEAMVAVVVGAEAGIEVIVKLRQGLCSAIGKTACQLPRPMYSSATSRPARSATACRHPRRVEKAHSDVSDTLATARRPSPESAKLRVSSPRHEKDSGSTRAPRQHFRPLRRREVHIWRAPPSRSVYWTVYELANGFGCRDALDRRGQCRRRK